MDNPNITMEEYIRLEEEKARRRRKVYNWEIAMYGKIWDNEDVHNLKSVETKFPAIVFNDTLTSEATLSCEPTVSSLKNDEIDFRISFDKSNDEDFTITFDKNSFSCKIISVNDLKTDLENDNDKVNMSFVLPITASDPTGYGNSGTRRSYEGFGTCTPSNDFTRLLLLVLGFTPGLVASLVALKLK
ncbi:hypothetical protein Tco_0847673 [Tanacetum coccineum]